MYNKVTSTTSEKYPKRFEEIYTLAKKFSSSQNSNLDEVFDQAVKFHDPQYSLPEIWQELEANTFKNASLNPKPSSSNVNYDVWLTFGETGQGKSTFTNTIYGSEVTEEGQGIKSKTESINLHFSNQHKIIIIDTPGLFDTRRIKNKEISNQVVQIVQDRLKQNARVNAIFFIWCPTYSMRLRFDEILNSLKEALGDGAIDSVVFIINKVSKLWNQDYEKLYDQFLDLLDENGLTNPVFDCDLKQMGPDQIKELRELTKEVKPFREEDFESHREMIYCNKFLETQKIDEEKKKEREKVERELGSKFEKRANEMEQKFKKDAQQMEEKFKNDMKKQEAENAENIRKIQEQHQSDINTLKERTKELELQMHQEREMYKKEAEKRAEEDRRNREKVRRREENLRNELLMQEAENIRRLQQQHQAQIESMKQQIQQLELQAKLEKEKREAEERRIEEEERRKIEEEERRKSKEEERRKIEEEERRKSEEEERRKIEEEERRKKEDDRRRQEEQRRRDEEAKNVHNYTPSPNYNYSPQPMYTSTATYVSTPVSNNMSTILNSSTSTGGLKFYKGGQFVPGGGRAPQGGCYMSPSTISLGVTRSTTYSNSGGSTGGKFYKGGQFTPGGGRAPKGGVRM